MKSPLIKSLAAAALVFALGSTARAQVMTDSTLAGFDASLAYGNGTSLLSGTSVTQTFTNITSFESLTFRFVANTTDSFGATSVDYVLSQWSGGGISDNALVPIPAPTFLSTAIAASGDWAVDPGNASFKFFDATIDLSAIGGGLSDSAFFGLSLIGDGTIDGEANQYRIGALAADTYANGTGYSRLGVTSFTDLTSGNIAPFAGDLDFAFAGSLSPVPEASSAAVLFSGLFVGTMVFSRSRRRRVVATADSVA